MTERLLAEAEWIPPDLVALRRRLHRQAEIGLHRTRTQELVHKALTDLDLDLEITLSVPDHLGGRGAARRQNPGRQCCCAGT